MRYNVRTALACTAALLALAACNTAGEAAGGSQPGVRADDAPAAADVPQQAAAARRSETMVVYKSPTCGCCGAWVDHAREAGFEVEVRDMPNVMPIKQEHGVPGHLSSCHTTLVGGYVVEGHVPVEDVRRLLDERPQIAGIAVPGMPAGSPGMEMGSRKDPYDVIAFTRDGAVSVYASH